MAGFIASCRTLAENNVKFDTGQTFNRFHSNTITFTTRRAAWKAHDLLKLECSGVAKFGTARFGFEFYG
jgi:hypothetical protein